MAQVFKNVMITYTFGVSMTRIDASYLSEPKGSEEFEIGRKALAEGLQEMLHDYSQGITGAFRDSYLDAATDIDVPSDHESYCEECSYSNIPSNATFCPGCGERLEA